MRAVNEPLQFDAIYRNREHPLTNCSSASSLSSEAYNESSSGENYSGYKSIKLSSHSAD